VDLVAALSTCSRTRLTLTPVADLDDFGFFEDLDGVDMAGSLLIIPVLYTTLLQKQFNVRYRAWKRSGARVVE